MLLRPCVSTASIDHAVVNNLKRVKSYVASGIACSITVVADDGRSNENKTTDNVSSSATVMAMALAPWLWMILICRAREFSSYVVLHIPSSGLTISSTLARTLKSPEVMVSFFIMVAVIVDLWATEWCRRVFYFYQLFIWMFEVIFIADKIMVRWKVTLPSTNFWVFFRSAMCTWTAISKRFP